MLITSVKNLMYGPLLNVFKCYIIFYYIIRFDLQAHVCTDGYVQDVFNIRG